MFVEYEGMSKNARSILKYLCSAEESGADVLSCSGKKDCRRVDLIVELWICLHRAQQSRGEPHRLCLHLDYLCFVTEVVVLPFGLPSELASSHQLG